MGTTSIYLPPLAQKSGGLAVLLEIGNILHGAGKNIRFVAQENAPWLVSAQETGVPVAFAPGFNQITLAAGDIWLIPEGWPGALLYGLQNPQAKTVLYVQNWAYLLTEQTETLPFHHIPVQFLAVSDPVAGFIQYLTGKTVPVLRPGINTTLFSPPDRQMGKTPVIAYMPRKNKVLARQIRSIVNARRAFLQKSPPVWQEIQGLAPEGVARVLKESDIFLATGFPEGCPLPPLEAMACGCLCVGFSGFGGLDYMRGTNGLPDFADTTFWHRAEDNRHIPFPNGFWTPDADTHAAAVALENAMALLENTSQKDSLITLQKNAHQTAAYYSTSHQKEHVLQIWHKLEQKTA